MIIQQRWPFSSLTLLNRYSDTSTSILNRNRIILTLSNRYKHKCEWFHRDDLYELWKKDTQNGETNLCNPLFDWLYNCGIELTIEPKSPSGKVDLICDQIGDDRLLIEAKIFNPRKSQNTRYLIHAFHQIYRYAVDYSQPFGYLVIFKTCEEHLINSESVSRVFLDILFHQRQQDNILRNC